jgi:hypothetical protein
VKIPTSLGFIVKTITVFSNQESISLKYDFAGGERPHGTIHAGDNTLLLLRALEV